jgi:hypothetical protein
MRSVSDRYQPYGHERGFGLSAVPNPSVTTPGSEVHMRGGLHKEPATGGTISIVAVRG